MNVLMIAGRLTGDGELKFLVDGKPVLNFSVATDVGWGEKKHPLFVRCALWGKRAESLDPYIKKGSPITVSGECDMRSWESNGKSGTSLELNVSEIELQGSKSGNQSAPEPAGGQGSFRDKPERTPQSDFADDDIPF